MLLDAYIPAISGSFFLFKKKILNGVGGFF